MRRATGALRGVRAILARREPVAAPGKRFLSQVASVSRDPLARPVLLFSRKDSRSFAEEAQGELPPPPPRVKLPKHVTGLHGKYATGLYVTCVRAEAVDRVEPEIRLLAEATAKSQEFQTFAENIFLSKQERVDGVKKAFGESKFHDITLNFLIVLAEDGQLKLFSKIAKTFCELMDARNGRIRTVITTADEMTSSEMEFIQKDVVSKLLESGQSPVIETRVDENIIGGCIVEVGDKMVDMSLGKRIIQIEKVLNDALAEIDAPYTAA